MEESRRVLWVLDCGSGLKGDGDEVGYNGYGREFGKIREDCIFFSNFVILMMQGFLIIN
jgi:hypothetical protein